MFINSNLKFLRKLRGKTQDEVCSSLKITRSTLNNYENSKVTPKNDTLIKFSEYFNISIDLLLKEDLSKYSERVLVNQVYLLLSLWKNKVSKQESICSDLE